MKREDAYFYMNLLLLGFSDGYDEWLESCLQEEDPMSDIACELYFCGSDVKKTISLLHNFCGEQKFDKSVVSDKFRLFFKDAYYSKRLSKGEIVSSMQRLIDDIGDPVDCDFDYDLWGDMTLVTDYYPLAENGTISWDGFDSLFHSYLNNDAFVNLNDIPEDNKTDKRFWGCAQSVAIIGSADGPTSIFLAGKGKKPSLLDKIKSLLR